MTELNPFTPSAEGEYNTGNTIDCANASHMALCFVLDISGSMQGPAIDALNDGMNRFKEMACRDSDTVGMLDVAIIAFDHEFEVLQNFLPVSEMMHINLAARGGTCFAAPMRAAIQMVKDRTKFYKQYTTPYKPWIVLVTDGQKEAHESQQDFDSIVEELRQQQTEQKLAVRALGVEGYDPKTLNLLADYKRADGTGWYKNVLTLNGYDFTDFFNWALKSMAAISHSSPGQAVPPVSLQKNGNVSVDQYDTSQMGK
jgi:uncharacterized protein YegL